MGKNYDLIPLDEKFVFVYNFEIVKAIEQFIEGLSERFSYSFTPKIRSYYQIPFISFRCKSQGKFIVLRFDLKYAIAVDGLTINSSLIDYNEDGRITNEGEVYNGLLGDFRPTEVGTLIEFTLNAFDLELT